MEEPAEEVLRNSSNVAATYDSQGQKKEQNGSTVSAAINPTLNREVNSPAKMAGFCSLMLLTEVSKQITSYGMKYYNGGIYPLPQTEIVALAELVKFSVFFLLTVLSDPGLQSLKISPWYAIPSVIYVVNNNVFYLALHYTTPPVWNILIQLRVVLTALTYRLAFHRTVTIIQWIALTLLISAIGLSNWSELNVDSKHHTHLTVAILLAVFGSVTSVIGTLVMEFLFKNDSRQFTDKQTQLYLFSSVCACCTWVIDHFVGVESHSDHMPSHPSVFVWILLICDLLLACLGGFMVAVVVKKFDNIVKLYTQALANMFTAVVCWVLFPDFFNLTLLFGLCLLIVFIAIIMYELKHFDALLSVGRAVLSHVTRTNAYFVTGFVLLTITITLALAEIFFPLTRVTYMTFTQ